MIDFCLLAEQSPENQWLEAHPQVMGAIVLAAALLNLLFALVMLLVPFLIIRKMQKPPPLALMAMYAPGAAYCALVLFMMLFAAYLFCGGSPSFR
ncbi:MAG: hypothetical protein ACKVP0_09905 [Pirellulaceae bacterium]